MLIELLRKSSWAVLILLRLFSCRTSQAVLSTLLIHNEKYREKYYDRINKIQREKSDL